MRFFSGRLKVQGRSATIDELDRAAIREWLATHADRLEPSTVKTRHRGMYRFGAWLVGKGELTDHPMKGMAQPVPKVTPVPVLSDDGLGRVLKACKGALTSRHVGTRP
ncbi:hypothetical protein [Nakamurella endophytica]|uniref:Core-binding (CB) domain-containing protein n=1 Tax=Nakamurella endophytica TaxID=1748367 RepID=A0A917WHL9_9ACTN|nr:hypothetical protein [Nakamurella endophytica]GGM04665.1 hypothetical protein GCM10011594_26160 [Nakamurella endophytica]